MERIEEIICFFPPFSFSPLPRFPLLSRSPPVPPSLLLKPPSSFPVSLPFSGFGDATQELARAPQVVTPEIRPSHNYYLVMRSLHMPGKHVTT